MGESLRATVTCTLARAERLQLGILLKMERDALLPPFVLSFSDTSFRGALRFARSAPQVKGEGGGQRGREREKKAGEKRGEERRRDEGCHMPVRIEWLKTASCVPGCLATCVHGC